METKKGMCVLLSTTKGQECVPVEHLPLDVDLNNESWVASYTENELISSPVPLYGWMARRSVSDPWYYGVTEKAAKVAADRPAYSTPAPNQGKIVFKPSSSTCSLQGILYADNGTYVDTVHGDSKAYIRDRLVQNYKTSKQEEVEYVDL